MLPSPIIYGEIIDGSCILWQQMCGGETGNCLLYDTPKLRRRLMFTTAGIMLFGMVFDILVCYEAKNLVIFNPQQKGRSKTNKENKDEHDDCEDDREEEDVVKCCASLAGALKCSK